MMEEEKINAINNAVIGFYHIFAFVVLIVFSLSVIYFVRDFYNSVTIALMIDGAFIYIILWYVVFELKNPKGSEE